ncbi:tape-measure protein [Streptomyces laurentii]|uniref:Tape-measure protein n=1 Tax=Streptomyces laurentii TaxID=39478 RepID=A0A160P1T2_STRLU|nr:tape-measure protein [Streptomyces laurentii]
MSAAAAFRNPFQGVEPVLSTLRRGLGDASGALTRIKDDARRASGGMDKLVDGLRTAASSVRAVGRDASGAAGPVRRIQRSKAANGFRKLGTVAGKAGVVAGLLAGPALGMLLDLLLPLLPFADTITKLMSTYGTVMEVASVAMTGVNLAMKSSPLGFLAGILVPVAAWLIEYAVNTETGQRVIRQVFQQALKGFQSVWKFLQPVIKLLGTVIGTYFKGYLTVVTTVLKVLVTAIDGLTHARSTVTSAVNALRGIASRTIGGIKSVIHPLLSLFTDKIPGFFRHAKDAAGKALNGMGELVKGGLSAVLGVVKGPISGLVAFANWIIDGLNKLSFNLLGKHFGVDIPKLPMLADGGVVFPGAADAPRIDPLAVLESRRVPAITEAPRPPHRIRDFHEDPGAGPRSTAEDLLFLAGARC